MASETGVLDLEEGSISEKGIVEPGKLFVVDTKRGEIVSDEEIKHEICGSKPFGQWISRNRLSLKDIDQHIEVKKMRTETLLLKQKIFGYTDKELKDCHRLHGEQQERANGSMKWTFLWPCFQKSRCSF
jgi:glutamate synthase (NADPH/NADH) large chain